MTALSIAPASVPLPPATEPLPVRSPRTSIILAELARQRRQERQQRRKSRIRRTAWLALFDPQPFESTRVQNPPSIIVAGTTPFVYAVAPAC